MPLKSNRTVKVATVSAAGGAGVVLGAFVAFVAINYAFRVPADLKKYVHKHT